MDLTRRQFTRLLGASAAAAAAGWARYGKPAALRCQLRALRGRFFPGRVHALRASDVRTRGKWLG